MLKRPGKISRFRRQRGQAFVEYVILIAVIALAALFVLANFSDRLRDMVNGITSTLGGTKSDQKDSIQMVQQLSADGASNTGN